MTSQRETENNFQQWTECPAELCGLTRAMIGQFICNASWLNTATTQIKSMFAGVQVSNEDERYAVQFALSKLKPDDIKELLSLFALGAQMAANVTGDHFAGGFDISERGGLPVYYDMSSNKIVIKPSFILQYVCIKYADQATHQAFRKQYLPKKSLLTDEALIRMGAEEYCHTVQHNDLLLRQRLEQESVQVYGTPWQQKRAERFAAALNALHHYGQGDALLKSFNKEDPWEKHADDILDVLQEKFLTVAKKYQGESHTAGM